MIAVRERVGTSKVLVPNLYGSCLPLHKPPALSSCIELDTESIWIHF